MYPIFRLSEPVRIDPVEGPEKSPHLICPLRSMIELNSNLSKVPHRFFVVEFYLKFLEECHSVVYDLLKDSFLKVFKNWPY